MLVSKYNGDNTTCLIVFILIMTTFKTNNIKIQKT